MVGVLHESSFPVCGSLAQGIKQTSAFLLLPDSGMGCSGSKGPAKGDNSFELARNPPIPKGHIILRGFGNALEQEYVSKQENAVERWISRDLEMVGRGADKELAVAGVGEDW